MQIEADSDSIHFYDDLATRLRDAAVDALASGTAVRLRGSPVTLPSMAIDISVGDAQMQAYWLGWGDGGFLMALRSRSATAWYLVPAAV
jgi:hypothetical protein